MADKIGNDGFIGAVGAAIAAFAMASRGCASKAKNPVGFPNDAIASVPKYQTAYSQLVSQAAVMRPLKSNMEAIDHALLAFETAKGTVPPKVEQQPTKPPSDKPPSDASE